MFTHIMKGSQFALASREGCAYILTHGALTLLFVGIDADEFIEALDEYMYRHRDALTDECLSAMWRQFGKAEHV